MFEAGNTGRFPRMSLTPPFACDALVNRSRAAYFEVAILASLADDGSSGHFWPLSSVVAFMAGRFGIGRQSELQPRLTAIRTRAIREAPPAEARA